MGAKDGGRKGRDFYISANCRLLPTPKDAIAANWTFEEAGGRTPCPDDDYLRDRGRGDDRGRGSDRDTGGRRDR
jgi:hypothetical protein